MIVLGRRALLVSALATPALAQRRPLQVQSYGANYEAALRETVIPAFEKDHGIPVTLTVGDETTTIPRLIAARGRSPWDAVMLNNDAGILLRDMGLLAPDQSGALSNIGRVYDSMKPPLAAVYGTQIYEYALVTNTGKGQAPLTSFRALWERPMVVGVPFIGQSYGLTFLYIAALLHGGSATNLGPGFEAIKRLPNFKVYKNVSQGLSLFQQGEIDAALYYGHRAQQMIDLGFPIVKTRAVEGSWGQRTGAQIPRGGPNIEGARLWVDTTLSVPYQTLFAGQLYSPTNRDVVLAPGLAAKHVMGEERVASIREAPWEELLPQRDALLDRWTREIGR